MGTWLRPPVLRTSFATSSAQPIFFVFRQSNCVQSQGSFAVAPKNRCIHPQMSHCYLRLSLRKVTPSQEAKGFHICIHYAHWFVYKIMRQRSCHNWKGSDNQQEIQNHDHEADSMVYGSPLRHGHELVDLQASEISCIWIHTHISIYIYMYTHIYIYIYICTYIYIYT